jgi:hypothetical protein
MSSSIDWDDFEVVVDIGPISSGDYHYRLLRVRGEGKLVFARRWEFFDSEAGEHIPDDGAEWEIIRGDEEISVEAVVGFSSK